MIFLFLFIMLCQETSSFANPPSLVFPTVGNTITDFVPHGWFLKDKIEGDLNKDGLMDTALIIDEQVFADDPAPQRALVVLFSKNGAWSFSASNDQLVFCATCGGMLGDPLQKLAIDRGVLVIELYGGSRDRWGMTYRFRWQNGNWYLIGYTHLTADTIELTSRISDFNWSTGAIEITSTQGEKSTKKRANKKLPPTTLKDATFELINNLAGKK